MVQAQGAFDQTIRGLYNAAEHGLGIEIRIVLHKQTLPRLPQLAEFIYRNLPFVDHIALMGLENMGYVKANWNLLWIDPVDYVETLEDVVKYFFYRRMHVHSKTDQRAPALCGPNAQAVISSDLTRLLRDSSNQYSLPWRCSRWIS